MKPIFIYGYPVMIMGIAGMINEVLSRIMLKYWLPDNFYPDKTKLESLGIFGACYKLSMFMSLAIQAFRYAAEPFFFSQAKEKNAPETYAKVMRYFILACLLIFTGVGLYLHLIGSIFLSNPAYREGLVVVPFLLLANMFLGIYYNLSVWYKLTDKNHYGTYISCGGALLTIGLNILLIPTLGYVGSALATLACYFSMAVASYLLGKKHYPVPYQTGAALGYISFACVLVYLSTLFDNSNLLLNLLTETAFLSVFIGTVFLIERKQLRLGSQ